VSTLVPHRAFAFAALLCAAAIAGAQTATESAVKAAFLYKFAGYIEWPDSAFPSPDAPLVIGVAGAEDVAGELEKLLPGRSIGTRKGVVRRVKEGDALKGVHVVFIGRRDPNVRAVVRTAQQAGSLTVTETGLEHGSAINFVVSDERIAFEVSLEAAERSGHRISSRMLAVAKRVVPKAPS
jgi:hypothetical protein